MSNPKTRGNRTRKGIFTGEIRDTVGVGTTINVHHEGPVKRPTETRHRIDDVTAEEIKKTPAKETPMNNPGFGRGGGKEGGG